MKRVLEPKITFTYLDAEDSEGHLKTAYTRLFAMARRNLLRRKHLLGIDVLHTVDPIQITRRKIIIINPDTYDPNSTKLYG